MNTIAKTVRPRTSRSLALDITKITAGIVAIGALANALVDLYRVVGNIPVAPQEKTNHALFQEHFGELPLFSQEVAIKHANSEVELLLEVYPGADVLVRYGEGAPQWLRARSLQSSKLTYIPFISSAHAQNVVNAPARRVTRSAQAIVRPPIVLDVDRAVVRPSRPIEVTAAAPAAANTIDLAYLLARTKDDHSGLSPSSRSYTEVYTAKPGYRIVHHRIQVSSASKASITSVQKSSDGLSLAVTYTIASGPAFDRWRGWIKGTVQTTQAPAQ